MRKAYHNWVVCHRTRMHSFLVVDSIFGIRRSLVEKRENMPFLLSFFPRVLEIAQPDKTRRDATANGVFRTSSSIIQYSSTFLWLRYETSTAILMSSRTLESGPYRVTTQQCVIQIPNVRRHQGGRIPSCILKHPVFCSILEQISGDHEYSEDPFTAFAEYEIILQKARKRTVRDFLKRTPESHGAKFLTASTASRAYGNRNRGTLMRCCETWEPVGKML